MRPFYLTTPIYYVNAEPHIGHIYTTIVADTLARYRRMAGDDVYFLTGTDEHGQKIERAAGQQGLAPRPFVDAVVAKYRAVWEQLGISHDDFIRTTETRHRAGVEALVRRLEQSGDLYTGQHEGWYCTGCEVYYTEKELRPGNVCSIHEVATEWRAEENVFFRLSRYEKPLLEWLQRNPKAIQPATRTNEIRSFIESGLRDLSVSRSGLAWGIPFPDKPGQTIYVWLDALTNYVSALGFGRPDGALYERYWQNDAPGAVRLHFVGKDIIRQHAVYWPAFLMAAGLPLPTVIWAHGFWVRDGRKVSKSLGNVERFEHVLPRFGPDVVRYFLLRDMVFGQDASYSDEAFVDRYNSDFANDLGNTVSRLVTLSHKAYAGRTPPVACDDNPVRTAALAAVEDYRAAMEELAFSRALEALWRLLAETNQYVVSREPWKLIQAEPAGERLSRVLWNGLEAVRIVCTGLLPFMPRVAPKVLAAIGAPSEGLTVAHLAWGGLATGAALPQPQPMFPRADRAQFLAGAQPPAGDATAAAPAPEAGKGGSPLIDIEQFFQTQLRVGKVIAAERVPKSDKLIKMQVDLAEERPRQLVAGIGKAYEPEALVGKQVVVVANLKPAKLMGVESQGMVLAATRDGQPVLLHPGDEVPPGTLVK
jgi:methionyl-tRNA synthetase